MDNMARPWRNSGPEVDAIVDATARALARKGVQVVVVKGARGGGTSEALRSALLNKPEVK